MSRRVHPLDSDNPDVVARAAGWRSALIVTGVVLFVLALSALVWSLTVASSGVKGEGDAVRIKNDGQNRVNANAFFEDTYQEVLAADRRIETAKAEVLANLENEEAATRLSGAIGYCQSVVADYNAEARKFTAREFRAADLPAQINNNDPATDCKES